LFTYLGVYFFYLATAVRILSALPSERYRWVIAGMLVVFVTLLALEPWLSRRSHALTHAYLAVQTAIIVALAIPPPHNDFYASLFFCLALQAMHVFPPSIGLRWVAAFSVVLSALMVYTLGWTAGLPLALIYSAGVLSIGSYVAFIRQAETSRRENRELLAELEVTHRRLQAHAAQAGELAVAQERGRLARNLHDSVTQTVFSMTLTAEAARLLFDRDPSRAASQLTKLQELARSALIEMRTLMQELGPSPVAEQGLIPALRQHTRALEEQHGLIVDVRATGEPALSDQVAQRLYRIAQEALNNVVKHAQVNQASVTLRCEDGYTLLQVQDYGRGFVPEAVDVGGKHMGLSSMRERAEMMGGILTVDSRPGQGTRVTVEVASAGGGE
jgi:signal transduction histidine kinase